MLKFLYLRQIALFELVDLIFFLSSQGFALFPPQPATVCVPAAWEPALTSVRPVVAVTNSQRAPAQVGCWDCWLSIHFREKFSKRVSCWYFSHQISTSARSLSLYAPRSTRSASTAKAATCVSALSATKRTKTASVCKSRSQVGTRHCLHAKLSI